MLSTSTLSYFITIVLYDLQNIFTYIVSLDSQKNPVWWAVQVWLCTFFKGGRLRLREVNRSAWDDRRQWWIQVESTCLLVMCSFHCSVPALESQTHRLLLGGNSFPRDACCHVKRYHHHSSTPASVISNSLSPTEGGKVTELIGNVRSSGWLPWA